MKKQDAFSTILSKEKGRHHRYLIGNYCVDSTNREDFDAIQCGLALFGTLLFDQYVLHAPAGVSAAACGRLVGDYGSAEYPDQALRLDLVIQLMDDCDDILIEMSSQPHGFKAHDVLERVRCKAVEGKLGVVSVGIAQLCSILMTQCTGEMEKDQTVVRECHQTCAFLHKLRIDRPDLDVDLQTSYLDVERAYVSTVEARFSDEYTRGVISEMNCIARRTLSAWDMPFLTPFHGPGAVSDPHVKCWYDKYLNMVHDGRLTHLLARQGLGTLQDYNPYVRPEKSERTSRFVGVPKTWKKLRGIAAEPIELQFAQQAVFRGIDRYIQDSDYWSERINLHDQSVSADLARKGSVNGVYATIDLSNASDTVSLELVKQVFRGTELLYWLLGTRSTHCMVGSETIQLRKFASMGSACCFPTESIVFTLAAQVASDRGWRNQLDKPVVPRVFGDDIIVAWYAVPELYRILDCLGFQPNKRKSYSVGKFREACGAECLAGEDIRPIRYRDLGKYLTMNQLQSEGIETLKAFANAFGGRGYLACRTACLSRLLIAKVRIGQKLENLRPYLSFSETGSSGTIASPTATNFNKVVRYSVPIQCLVERSLVWRLRKTDPVIRSEMSDRSQMLQYLEWLLGHRPEVFDGEFAWRSGWLDQLHDVGLVKGQLMGWSRLPIGFKMTPTTKWVSVWASNPD